MIEPSMGLETCMRIAFSSLLAVGLLTSQMAAAQNCARPTDKTAFDVAGLKSQLMVAAITCEVTERYNSFILRFRPDLVAPGKGAHRLLHTQFRQEGASAARRLHHRPRQRPIAEWAESRHGFLRAELPTFESVMKLHGSTELTDFATGQAPVQPIELVGCAISDRPTRATVRTASATVATKTKTR